MFWTLKIWSIMLSGWTVTETLDGWRQQVFRKNPNRLTLTH